MAAVSTRGPAELAAPRSFSLAERVCVCEQHTRACDGCALSASALVLVLDAVSWCAHTLSFALPHLCLRMPRCPQLPSCTVLQLVAAWTWTVHLCCNDVCDVHPPSPVVLSQVIRERSAGTGAAGMRLLYCPLPADTLKLIQADLRRAGLRASLF